MEKKLFRFKRIRAQIRLFLPVLFLLFSLILIVLGASDSPSLVKTRKVVMEVLIPVVNVIHAPVNWLKEGGNKIKNWSLTYQENETLKQENAALKQWQTKAFELKEKLSELEKHLNYVPPQKAVVLTADILLDEGSGFSRSFFIRAGEKEGVKKGMLGFGPKALAGRVVEVGEHHSYFMTLTDYMSRLPVWVGEKHVEAFLIGDNTQTPFLQLVNSDDAITEGSLVMTSGYMGGYPANLPLGTVKFIHENEAVVSLFENGRNISVIKLIDFGLSKSVFLKDE